MRLQIKVLLLVIGILLVIGAISGGTILYYHRNGSIRQFQQMAVVLAGTVRDSLERSMLTGDRRQIQEAVSDITKEDMVTGVVLFSHDAVVAASSGPVEPADGANSLELQQVLASGNVSMRTERPDGMTRLSVFTPVFNKSECQSCHSPGDRVLGAIQIGLDATLIDNQARQESYFIGIAGLLTLALIGAGLALALKKTVLNPLDRLTLSASKLSQGDYSQRVEGGKNDELGLLAKTFNDMAASVEQRTRELEDSRQELAEWNLGLEDKVKQRTRELSALTVKLEEANKVTGQLLEKLISAQEEERRRIARELHDNASQSLAALAIRLEAIAEDLPDEYKDLRKRLEDLNEQAVRTIGGLRNLALEIRPSALDNLGLAKAMDWYAKDYLAKKGLEVKIEVHNPDVKLPSHTETMLFRIVQEALTNVVKHARATRVKVSLELGEPVVVQVEDNGAGFDVEAAMARESIRQHLGLHGMAERAALLGGKLTISSEPGKGTRLRVEVPLGGVVVNG